MGKEDVRLFFNSFPQWLENNFEGACVKETWKFYKMNGYDGFGGEWSEHYNDVFIFVWGGRGWP